MDRGLYQTVNAMWAELNFSAPEAFFLLLKLSPFQDLTFLEGGSNIASGKEYFSSSYKGALAMALPNVT
jgi:hypothetical protein